ncbi:putative N-acetyltransferase domain-containing protein [Vibrio phage 172P1]|nr:putative N-acetyltransferase domain-containing protein [Vibrio phage 172P1]
MITIQEETTLGAVLESVALGVQHYNEVESKATSIGYNPDLAQFKALLELGMLLLVTARDENRNLVGYFCMITVDDILTGSPSAQELGIFVTKAYRGGSTFVRMERLMNHILKGRGYKEMRVMFKTGHNTDIPIRLGYEETERVYQKLL